MPIVNMQEAQASLAHLVEEIESSKESEIIIARDGRPAARLVPIPPQPGPGPRIGIAKGKFTIPDDFGALDAEIEALFYESADPLLERQQD
jgi:antitoxin (DNA-binding transcriptional repressor) of toxin-antitoxin stability system